ncbi:lytic transglycosylase domain-containing protein [Amaricoccus sp. W119]|uniref:lytic transglycosylase domain-containing protein n=1 Tax=Amaricoccus sp. W119 TaxID=3391833 RepID=UPI0039A413EC
MALGLLSGSWRVAAHAAPGVDRRLLDPAGPAELGGSVRHHRPRLVKPVIRRRSEVIRSGLFLLATLASQSAGPAYSEVWEFDTDGTLLTKPAPSGYGSDNKPYDVEQFPGTPFPRAVGRLAAIYRPMAEGVARAFAGHPGVVAAGLDTDAFARLFTALIDQESRFNPNAVSPKGARGLGQLMPETAAALGVADAFEPLANLHGAARYLTAQLEIFGRVDLALAAYNAGPHRVTRTAGVPPFRETRDYIARITAAAGLARTGSTETEGRLATENFATVSTRNAPSDAPEPTRASRAGDEPVLLTRADGSFPERADTPFSQPRQGTVLEWPN